MSNALKPLVFACAGSSMAGQIAYMLAVELDRCGQAEMSCLSGVGARRKVFLGKMKHRRIWLVDGCAIACAQEVMDELGHEAHVQIKLHESGVPKHAAPPDSIDLTTPVNRALAEADNESEDRRIDTPHRAVHGQLPSPPTSEVSAWHGGDSAPTAKES